MKRFSALMLFFIWAAGLQAEERLTQYEDKEIPEITLSTDELEGKAKAGIALGYPFGFTFGYRMANYLEGNVFAGTHFNDDFTLGANLLFTIVNINIGEEIFPLSVGPAVYCSFGKEFGMAAGASVRSEYTFDEIPLNLYLEATPGLTFINDLDFYIAMSLGIRYVF